MRLIYTKTGKEVTIGDLVTLNDGDVAEVSFFRKPHKPSSGGKVSVTYPDKDWQHEFFVSVIGAEWIEREDRRADHV